MNELNERAKQLGYSFVYHYNTYNGKWAAIPKGSLKQHFNGYVAKNGESTNPHTTGYGVTIEEAIQDALAKK